MSFHFNHNRASNHQINNLTIKSLLIDNYYISLHYIVQRLNNSKISKHFKVATKAYFNDS